MYLVSKFLLQKEILKIQRKALIFLAGTFENYMKDGVYYNEANRYKLKTTKLVIQEDGTTIKVKKKPIPRVGIFLYFAIHSYPIDKKGFVKNVNTKEIAKRLGVTHNAIIYNIKRLIENELIYASKVKPYTYNFYIVDYEKTFLTTKKGGSGYVNITEEMFEELLKIKDINSLRLELRKILQHSRDYNIGMDKYYFTTINKPSTKADLMFYEYNPNIEYSKIPYSKYKIDELKHFLPKYLRYPKKIKELSNNSKIFNNKTKKDKIFFKLKTTSARETLLLKPFEYASYFKKRLKELYPQVKKKQIKDASYTLGILSLHEYGFKNVKQAVEDIAFNYERPVKNLVGFIRTYLENPREFSLISKEEVMELEKETA